MNKDLSKKFHKQSHDDLKKDFIFGKKPEEKKTEENKPKKKYGTGRYGR